MINFADNILVKEMDTKEGIEALFFYANFCFSPVLSSFHLYKLLASKLWYHMIVQA